MALDEFWRNVRFGAGLVAPNVIVDASGLDAGTIEDRLRGATLWLTPRAVDGFDEGDFAFLGVEDRSRIAKLVSDFRDEAAKVGPKDPAPPDVVRTAFPLFRDLVKMLEFDRFADPEAYRLGKQIEREVQGDWPSELAELRFNTGLDHTGDPGLWIWVLLTEEISRRDEDFLGAAKRLRPLLDSIARRIEPDRWPYMSFRPVREPDEVETEVEAAS
jgi:hypothetical protein